MTPMLFFTQRSNVLTRCFFSCLKQDLQSILLKCLKEIPAASIIALQRILPICHLWKEKWNKSFFLPTHPLVAVWHIWLVPFKILSNKFLPHSDHRPPNTLNQQTVQVPEPWTGKYKINSVLHTLSQSDKFSLWYPGTHAWNCTDIRRISPLTGTVGYWLWNKPYSSKRF